MAQELFVISTSLRHDQKPLPNAEKIHTSSHCAQIEVQASFAMWAHHAITCAVRGLLRAMSGYNPKLYTLKRISVIVGFHMYHGTTG